MVIRGQRTQKKNVKSRLLARSRLVFSFAKFARNVNFPIGVTQIPGKNLKNTKALMPRERVEDVDFLEYELFIQKLRNRSETLTNDAAPSDAGALTGATRATSTLKRR